MAVIHPEDFSIRVPGTAGPPTPCTLLAGPLLAEPGRGTARAAAWGQTVEQIFPVSARAKYPAEFCDFRAMLDTLPLESLCGRCAHIGREESAQARACTLLCMRGARSAERERHRSCAETAARAAAPPERSLRESLTLFGISAAPKIRVPRVRDHLQHAHAEDVFVRMALAGPRRFPTFAGAVGLPPDAGYSEIAAALASVLPRRQDHHLACVFGAEAKLMAAALRWMRPGGSLCLLAPWRGPAMGLAGPLDFARGLSLCAATFGRIRIAAGITGLCVTCTGFVRPRPFAWAMLEERVRGGEELMSAGCQEAAGVAGLLTVAAAPPRLYVPARPPCNASDIVDTYAGRGDFVATLLLRRARAAELRHGPDRPEGPAAWHAAVEL